MTEPNATLDNDLRPPNDETENRAVIAQNRPCGRPPRGERVIGPKELEMIMQLYLQETHISDIADRFGVAVSTIRHHIDHYVKPLLRDELRRLLGREIAKVTNLERVAWERFRESQKAQTRLSIQRGGSKGDKEDPGCKGVVKRAVQKTSRVGDARWLSVIQWCIEWRSRVGGYYETHEGDHDEDEYRVAGRSLTDLDQEFLQRLREGIASRIEYGKAMAFWEGRQEDELSSRNLDNPAAN